MFMGENITINTIISWIISKLMTSLVREGVAVMSYGITDRLHSFPFNRMRADGRKVRRPSLPARTRHYNDEYVCKHVTAGLGQAKKWNYWNENGALNGFFREGKVIERYFFVFCLEYRNTFYSAGMSQKNVYLQLLAKKKLYQFGKNDCKYALFILGHGYDYKNCTL